MSFSKKFIEGFNAAVKAKTTRHTPKGQRRMVRKETTRAQKRMLKSTNAAH